ncbi:MAG: PKD domain-containing protein [Planctomycetes bacterium]|nr:PKD domain-containing protein [Planctomycetota bacterium]
MQTIRSVFASALFTAVAAAQLSLVAPDGYANAEGNTGNLFPWQVDATSIHIQFLYDSSHFTNQNVVSPIVISRLRYRANATTSSWTGGSWPNVRIDMATATTDYATPSATFAANTGPDLTTVLTGPVTVQPGTGNGAGVPGPWYIDIPLTTPFLYDPTSGNDLVVDIMLDGTGWTGVSTSADHVSASGNPPSRVSRVYSTAGATATTGTVGANYGAVCEFGYSIANGLYANFTSDVTGGASPLAVHFADASHSSAPGGLTGWAWDFDGDSVVDSTLQNPTFVFQACGSYDVTLTVTDGANPPNTITKTAYVVTDRIAADFLPQVVGPLAVLFTDTSNLPATSWAWDLDGDSVVDSTLQTAAWIYPNGNPVDVTLTVTRLCAPPSTITRTIVPLQELSQNVAPNNGNGNGGSVYFDLDVTNPQGVNINSLDVAPGTANVPFTVEMFVMPGTHVGNEGASAMWVSAGTGTSAGGSTTATASASVGFATPIHLPAGVSGVKLWFVGVGPRYQTGTGTVTVANGDLAMTLGTVRGSSSTDPWAGGNLSPRWWSGKIYYDTHAVSGLAGFGAFGPGCAGTLGVPHLAANRPQLGTTMSITVDNLPLSAAILLTGFSNTASSFGALPVDLAGFGAPGCMGRVSTDATMFLAGANHTATWSLNVPIDGAFSGLMFFTQALALDPGANTLGAVTSDAGAWILGN